MISFTFSQYNKVSTENDKSCVLKQDENTISVNCCNNKPATLKRDAVFLAWRQQTPVDYN